MATVNGYTIRPVSSVRFGRLFLVEQTGQAFSTLALAKAWAEKQPDLDLAYAKKQAAELQQLRKDGKAARRKEAAEKNVDADQLHADLQEAVAWAINTFGTGMHPLATQNGLRFFRLAYALKAVKKARKSSAANMGSVERKLATAQAILEAQQ